MATGNLSWKVHDALDDLDRKQNYLERAKQRANNACHTFTYYGARALLMAGAAYIAISASAKFIDTLLPEKKIEAYETSRNKNNALEEKYSGLAKKVSEKTGVDERILLGLIAGGKTTYANDLRADGYVGFVPLKPEEAGVTAETLNNDDEQCLLSAARVFKDIAEKQKSTNLEAAVSSFWFREKEAEAGSFRNGWKYISSAINAYNVRTNADNYAKAQEDLMYHQGALNYEKMLAELPEEERLLRRRTGIGGTDPLQRKITNPARLFHNKAIVEAYERNRAGDEFTWIDLLPPKLSAAVCCSLAYMNGVEFKSVNGSGE